jgi:hypothetical protein
VVAAAVQVLTEVSAQVGAPEAVEAVAEMEVEKINFRAPETVQTRTNWTPATSALHGLQLHIGVGLHSKEEKATSD